MVKCKGCEKSIPVSSNYCPSCGARVALETRIKKWNPTKRKATNLAKKLEAIELQRRGIRKESDIEKQMLSLLGSEKGFRHR